MSRIDYSKWNKIELSDDEDIEVHPNIDKASFIRWKQQDIRRKREERRARIQQLQSQPMINQKLFERMNVLEKRGLKMDDLDGEIESLMKSGLENDAERPEGSQFSYDHMIAELLKKIKKETEEGLSKGLAVPSSEDWVSKCIRIHRDELKRREVEEAKELAQLIKEEASTLTVDKLTTTHEKTIVNKPTTSTPAASKEASQKKTSTIVEVLNPGRGSAVGIRGDATTDLIKTPWAVAFSHIASFPDSFEFLRAHPELVSAAVSDEILAEAFSQQMEGHSKRAESCVRQALILQYVNELGISKMDLFFARMASSDHKARTIFQDDYDFKINHIRERAKVLREERKEKERARKAMEEYGKALENVPEDQKLDVTIPEDADERGRKRGEAFNSLPAAFQRALVTGNAEMMNQVLENLGEEEAQRIMKLCADVGLLEVASEDEDEGDDALD